jgi:hypothetical protein
MGMITDETFSAYLHCWRKAFLKATDAAGERHDIERVRTDLDGAYSRRALEDYLARYGEGDIVRSPPSLEAAVGKALASSSMRPPRQVTSSRGSS